MPTVRMPRLGRTVWRLGALAAGALLVSVTAPVQAQTINGLVVDSTTSEPISGSDLLLLDSEGHTVATVKAGGDGRFSIAAKAGSYRLRARCPGHRAKDTPVEVAGNAEVTIRLVRLEPSGGTFEP